MQDFCEALLASLKPVASGIHAWCVLPNHYHVLASTPDLRSAVWSLGKLHGRMSFQWNKQENARATSLVRGG